MLAVPVAAPQAWLFELLSLVFCAIFVTVLVRKRKESGGQRKPNSRHGIVLQGVAFAFTAIGPTRAELAWFGPAAVAAYVAILLLMGGGIGLFARSSRSLGKNWSLEARTRDDHELVRTGPYAHVRHPIYLAMLLFLLSMAVALGHWLQLLLAIPSFLLGTKMRMEAEEELLEQSFGETFRNYRRSTPAIIPKIS
jgi:protein-S-isoprenylcysteine O-methyltransferase Ste14